MGGRKASTTTGGQQPANSGRKIPGRTLRMVDTCHLRVGYTQRVPQPISIPKISPVHEDVRRGSGTPRANSATVVLQWRHLEKKGTTRQAHSSGSARLQRAEAFLEWIHHLTIRLPGTSLSSSAIRKPSFEHASLCKMRPNTASSVTKHTSLGSETRRQLET